MALKAKSLVILGMLLGSTLLVPLGALADSGLTVIVFVTPANRAVGEDVSVNVQIYQYATLVDVDTINGTASYGGTYLNFSNVSTGVYRADLTLSASDAPYGSMTVAVTAHRSTRVDTGRDYYVLRPTIGVSAAWDVRARIVNLAEVGPAPALGQTVVVEARSYLGGSLMDGGPINATVNYAAGFTYTMDPLNGTKVSDGVYRFSFTTPSSLAATKAYSISATLGSGYSAPSDTVSFQVDPFPVMFWVPGQSATTANVKVLVGGATAISGATVSVYGVGLDFTTFQLIEAGPFNKTTDAQGAASVDADFPGSVFLSWSLTVTSGGKQTVRSLYFGTSGSSGWTPSPNAGYGCSLKLQTDPSTFVAGHSATMKFRMTVDGVTVSNTAITRWVWQEGAPGPEQSGNVTTDVKGNFTVTWVFPANFTASDILAVMALCPNGLTDNVDVKIPLAALSQGALQVSAQPATAGGALTVTATYSGTNALNGATATAFLVPGGDLSAGLHASTEHAPAAVLTRSGTQFSGTISVPSWFPDSDYVVMVTLSNMAAAPTSGEEFSSSNATVVHVANAAQTPGGGAPPAKGFLPGFDGVAALAAVGAGAAVLVVGRRRRLE